ncbi:hypothetical protein [Saccharopolyspora shandongensis]|uniref:hypothetical protein n=1 Tax=Saccharopolyspora shandongensis TaxID=418495 RepID=UPI0033EB7E94
MAAGVLGFAFGLDVVDEPPHVVGVLARIAVLRIRRRDEQHREDDDVERDERAQLQPEHGGPSRPVTVRCGQISVPA